MKRPREGESFADRRSSRRASYERNSYEHTSSSPRSSAPGSLPTINTTLAQSELCASSSPFAASPFDASPPLATSPFASPPQLAAAAAAASSGSCSSSADEHAARMAATQAAASRAALATQLAGALGRMCALAAAPNDTLWMTCKRCEQCNACYEAAALNTQRHRAALLAIAQRIAAVQATLPDAQPQPTAVASAQMIAVLQATDGWEAAWEAGRAAASFEQQLEALWERAQTIMQCVDRGTALAAMPPELHEAARLAGLASTTGLPQQLS